MPALRPDPAKLLEPIRDILLANPNGVSEYQLMQQLDSADIEYFAPSQLNPLSLFQRHFLLFHCLYRLRQALLAEQSAILDISALNIRLHPYRAGESQLATTDTLADYYLDITHLDTTDEVQVSEMLEHFWTRLLQRDDRQQALQQLGLSDPVDEQQIQRRYRELVRFNHPDRGGDNERLQQLNAALAILLTRKKNL